MEDKWFLKSRHLHREGRVIYDKLNQVVVCELSEPKQEFVEHHRLEIGSGEREVAAEHAQLIMAAPYAVSACYKLAKSVLELDFEKGIVLHSDAVDEAITVIRQLEGMVL